MANLKCKTCHKISFQLSQASLFSHLSCIWLSTCVQCVNYTMRWEWVGKCETFKWVRSWSWWGKLLNRESEEGKTVKLKYFQHFAWISTGILQKAHSNSFELCYLQLLPASKLRAWNVKYMLIRWKFLFSVLWWGKSCRMCEKLKTDKILAGIFFIILIIELLFEFFLAQVIAW